MILNSTDIKTFINFVLQFWSKLTFYTFSGFCIQGGDPTGTGTGILSLFEL